MVAAPPKMTDVDNNKRPALVGHIAASSSFSSLAVRSEKKGEEGEEWRGGRPSPVLELRQRPTRSWKQEALGVVGVASRVAYRRDTKVFFLQYCSFFVFFGWRGVEV